MNKPHVRIPRRLKRFPPSFSAPPLARQHSSNPNGLTYSHRKHTDQSDAVAPARSTSTLYALPPSLSSASKSFVTCADQCRRCQEVNKDSVRPTSPSPPDGRYTDGVRKAPFVPLPPPTQGVRAATRVPRDGAGYGRASEAFLRRRSGA